MMSLTLGLVVLVGLVLLALLSIGLLGAVLAAVSPRTRGLGLGLVALVVLPTAAVLLAWLLARTDAPSAARLTPRADSPARVAPPSPPAVAPPLSVDSHGTLPTLAHPYEIPDEALELPGDAADDNAVDEERTERAAREEQVAGRVVYPENRPEWVERDMWREGDIDWLSVSSGPHYSEGRGREALREEVEQAVARYVNEHLGVTNAEWALHYEVRPRERFDEQLVFTFGPMRQSHALLRFDRAFRDRVERDWREHVAARRLAATGGGIAGVLGLLATALLVLRAKIARAAGRAPRLRSGAVAAILAFLAAGGVLWGWLRVV